MTESERLAYVRERIAQVLYEELWPIPWKSVVESVKRHWLSTADAVLSLKDKQGNPLLAILSEDQTTTERCPRCEGNGEIYADGKAHFYTEHAPTINCHECGGRGSVISNESGFRRVIL